MTRVKVCGITRPADRDVAVRAGADALGFIVNVAVESPRAIPADAAADLIEAVPPFVTTVLVTMPDDAATARALRDRTGADVIQLHGELSPATVGEIAADDAPVIKAVDGEDTAAAHRYAGIADAILVDSTRASGGGGTGRTHDWATTRELRAELDVPVILAGGLTPANVADAVRQVGPYAVDVASGVEQTGGEKDHEAVHAFVANATRAPEAASR